MSDVDVVGETIPARRLMPKDHLSRAARASVASDAEHYHLGAATAEALLRIEESLRAIEGHLGLIAKVLVDEALREKAS